MTNYEYLVKNQEEIAKKALASGHIAKVNGKIVLCRDTGCKKCDFDRDKNNGKPCNEVIREWLDKEHIVKPLPCPFCGSENVHAYEMVNYVECNDCGIATKCYHTIEEALEVWNRRV